MGKDFDSERRQRHEEREAGMGDRSFIFGGEQFVYRANVRFDILRAVASVRSTTEGDVIIETVERAVLGLIEDTDGAHERFVAICQREEDPITWQDLQSLEDWLIAEQVQRPTQAPLPSTPGRETTGTQSTDASSIPPAEASAA